MVDFNDFKKSLAKNKDISEDVITLPSNKNTKLTIRPMKVKEQRAILKALEKKDEYLVNTAFDQLLERCVISVDGESFDCDDLIIQDRSYVLIKIRQLSTGNEAKISHICPVSGKVVNDIEIDLNDLDVDFFDDEEELAKEIQLSDSVKVKVGPVTRKDEKQMDKWAKNSKDKDSIIDKRYCAYASIIKEIQFKGEDAEDFEKVETTYEQKVQFVVDSCSHKDLEKFDEYLKTLDFGIRLKFHFKSDEYENEEEEVNLISFFIM